MSRIHVTALLAFSTLMLPVSIACGQTTFSSSSANSTSNQGSAKENVTTCQAAPGGSRMRNRRNSAECETAAAAETTVRAEQQLNVTLEVPAPDELACEATTTTQYSQRNTVARVSGTVDILNCPAGSAGTFDVVARVRDESGEIKPIEFAQTWQRDDAGDAPFTSDYPIGENVELVTVRVRNLKCTCAAAPQAAPAVAPQPN